MKTITIVVSLFILLVSSAHAQQQDDILSFTMANTDNINVENTASLASLFDINEALAWEDNGAELQAFENPVSLNLSAGIQTSLSTEVSYTAMQRIWKIEEVSDNSPRVIVKIPLNAVAQNSVEGHYYMLTSNSNVFDASSSQHHMTLDSNGNLETTYNFEGITYITFAFAPVIEEERAIYFNGTEDYIDIDTKLNLQPSGFSLSAWIKPSFQNAGAVSILAKRNAAFTEGFDFTLSADNKIGIAWHNSSLQSLSSTTSIPNDQWHHVAVTYNGTQVFIYIDGVLDISASRTAPEATNAAFLIGAANKTAPMQHFKGHIDEVRIWNTHLKASQMRFIMNQEITNNAGQVTGKLLPNTISKNEIDTISWLDLAGYYPMSAFSYKTTLDASGNGNHGELKHLLSVDKQSAPLPYESKENGDWDSSATWTNGDTQYSPGTASIVNPNVTIDWNIVRTAHNLSIDNSALPAVKRHNRTLLALYVNDHKLTLQGSTETHTGNGLTITHLLELAGKIDLEGESQLIQTDKSDLNVISSGSIERDQQGTADTYTYNYWSSPVTKTNAEYSSFKITDVMKDGTDAANPMPINFSSSGYNGAATSPIRIADYWIWKYANQPSQNFSSWQHIRRTGSILPGEGFTMKGPGTGAIETPQNYVFSGKPNNGNINLTLAPNNDYLVGNPYPSAIDANIFIRDNSFEFNSNTSTNPNSEPLISGTLYFWKHWGGGSHVLQNYQGGYATYNLSGAVAAASKGSVFSSSITQQLMMQKPDRYIPVGQGFFVEGLRGGTIRFNNSQRVFKKEDNANFTFMRPADTESSQNTPAIEDTDERMKFRIGLNSMNTIHRQLLLTIDDNASTGIDWAYDGLQKETQMDDLFWIINDEDFIIQGSNEAEITSVYPIGIKTSSSGLNSITIDELDYVPDDFNIYVHDKDLNLYHDLRASDYELYLNPGVYRNRLEITFGADSELLNLDENASQNLAIIYTNERNNIVLINPNQIELSAIEIYNLLGQSVDTITTLSQSPFSEYNTNTLSTGAYIVKLYTASNVVITKKILVD